MFWRIAIPVLLLGLTATCPVMSQPLGEADRGQPGDAMIQSYLAGKAEELHARFPADLKVAAGASADTWRAKRDQYQQQYFYMLGLWPLPAKTPLQATTANELRGDGYVIEMLHYQSRPRLYVTANLYRPEAIDPGQRLPAILYVCGHAGRGRNGNKTAFQSHGIWFARHGYVCLVVDTLQLSKLGYQWPWTRIAALAAPRPFLFVNSDQDSIFPMDANQRVISRLERLYSLYGAGDQVDAVVSIGGHAYRQDIRQVAYRFLNTHLNSAANLKLP